MKDSWFAKVSTNIKFNTPPQISPTGVLFEGLPAFTADRENPAVVHGSNHSRAWIFFPRRKTYPSSTTSRRSYHTLRSMATALLSRSRTTTSLPLPFHIQHILQRTMARPWNPRYLRERVSGQTCRVLCTYPYGFRLGDVEACIESNARCRKRR